MNWEDFYNPLRASGIINTQRDLSVLAGGSPSLMSSSKARSRKPSLATMAGLFSFLDELDGQTHDLLMTGQQLTEEQRQAAATVYRVKEEVLLAIKRRALAGRKDGSR